jgi:hypothetical protein
MKHTLTFSRSKLGDYLACQRRYQLRYLRQRAWPIAPLAGTAEKARNLGQRFHLRLQRHFLNMPLTEEMGDDPQIRAWWRRFADQGPTLPAGQQFVEYSLTVPIGRSQLTGRFDLLIFGDDEVTIFDWKTDARARPAAVLSQDLQSRLYLALAVEGSGALGEPISADQVRLTYWFVNDPAATVTIPYSQAQHERNWADLVDLVTEIESQLATQGAWPLTDDLARCEGCAYQAYCGRQVTVQDSSSWLEENMPVQLEPELP